MTAAGPIKTYLSEPFHCNAVRPMNQISPLYKIALLLCSSVCLQICCTPPTAPPTESEREKFDSSGDVVEIHLPRALHGKVPIIQQVSLLFLHRVSETTK